MPSIINATTTNGVAVSGDNSGELALQTNNGNTAVSIGTNGSVGIGTTSPGARLQVNGAGTTTNDAAIRISNPNTSAFSTATIDLFANGLSRSTILGQQDGSSNSGTLIFFTRDSSSVLQERSRFVSDGTFLVGKTVADQSTNGLEVFQASTNNVFAAMTAGRTDGFGSVMVFNRQGSDGVLITFRQANTDEGSISVSGTTVSYNGGHLSRWSQLLDNQKDETLLKGTVMSNLDDMCVWVKDGEELPNEQLNKMKVSDVEGDTNVAGVFVNWTFDEQCQSDDMNIAMTGDMIIRIAEGVTVQKGDLLMSAGDGTAKPQGDDIVRSKTIAKVTSNYVTCTYADGSYCVPCVLMAC